MQMQHTRIIGRRRTLCSLCAGTGLLALGLPALAQTALAAPRPVCRYSLDDNAWSDTGPREYLTRRAGPHSDPSGIPQVVRAINDSLSISPEFDIFISEGDDNAMAAVAGGRRIIVFDVGFLARLNRVVGTRWSAISVVAHEVGHHIAGFSHDRHRSELNADYWSGQSLQRLGSSKRAATRTILRIGTDWDTRTHPNRHARAAKIERGWEDAYAGRIDYSHCLDCR